MTDTSFSRRTFVATSGAVLAGTALLGDDRAQADENSTLGQAMGTRAGEATDSTAIVWTRLTAAPIRNNDGVVVSGRAKDFKSKQLPEANVPVEQLEGACPGAAGKVRLRYSTQPDFGDAITTPWAEVSAENDFIYQFALKSLQAAAVYHYEGQSMDTGGKTHGVVRGEFRTAPLKTASTDVMFCVMSCQGYPDRGHADGHDIYPAMQSLNPHFACLTGDLVYYDNDMPRATSPPLARYHWERMFSLPRLIEFNRKVGTYWLKDDHDTLNNDSWPGAKMGSLTFAEGQRIFRQQSPMADGPSYRTFRWGRDLQIWLTDGRDFRSPNNQPDGPEKTIWGAEQKAWFKRTVKASDATWKVLISPTPLVGPDRPSGKHDNHANTGFAHEGDELRGWLKANVPDNCFVICGDRHWQYHSVHPQTGLREFSVGAASDEHAGGTPGENLDYHQFHRVKGGFLSVSIAREASHSNIHFRHHDVNGTIVHQWSQSSE